MSFILLSGEKKVLSVESPLRRLPGYKKLFNNRMATLVYSDKCPYCSQVIQEIRENPALIHMIRFHNVSTQGVPSKQITRVPTLVTNDGRLLVGNDVRKWIESMKPEEKVEEFDQTVLSGAMLDDTHDNDAGNYFDIDHFNMPLAPPMTRELEEKVNRKVTDAYQKGIK
jgi:glutaredoxin-related protein